MINLEQSIFVANDQTNALNKKQPKRRRAVSIESNQSVESCQSTSTTGSSTADSVSSAKNGLSKHEKG